MARRIIIETLCDPCLSDNPDTRNEGVETTIRLGKMTRALALCKTHDEQILAPLRALIESLPSVDSKGTQTTIDDASTVMCPVTDCSSRTQYANMGSLGKHLKSAHDRSVAEVRAAYPDWSAGLPSRPSGLSPTSPGWHERTCTLCAYKSQTGQALAGHLRIEHPELSLDERRAIVAQQASQDVPA